MNTDHFDFYDHHSQHNQLINKPINSHFYLFISKTIKFALETQPKRKFPYLDLIRIIGENKIIEFIKEFVYSCQNLMSISYVKNYLYESFDKSVSLIFKLQFGTLHVLLHDRITENFRQIII